MKKTYGILLGILFMVMGVLAFSFMNEKESSVSNKDLLKVPVVEVETKKVKLTNIPYIIEATGTLQAADKIELFSEVQGVLQRTNTPFKLGNKFKRGAVLIAIDSKEYETQIKSARSDLMNQIAAMLPDMEMDYPESYQKWGLYLEGLNVDKWVPALPEFSSNEEKLFVSGKNVYNTYFNIKNQEERLNKYDIRAPFDGIVTECNVNVGTLIRSGQKLGEFVDDSTYELKLSVPATENKYLKKGTVVNLSTVDGSATFMGAIARINGKIDQDTQSIEIIVEVSHEDLKDGEYIKAQIEGEELVGVFSVANSLILENNQVYIVEDNRLQLKPIEVLNYQDKTVTVVGLENGMEIVNETIAGAHPGMVVQPSSPK